MSTYWLCCKCGNASYRVGGGGWYCEYYGQYREGTEDGYGCPGWCEEGEGSSSSSGSSGCFLTSACVKHLGKADDCVELETLRKFRDEYLAKTDDGIRLIKTYYAVAPQIVQGIDNSPNADKYYDGIYATICNCLELIAQNKFEEAIQAYKNMVLSLQKEFGVI